MKKSIPMNPHDIIIRPILTEKTYMLMEEGKYTFEVHPDATKPDIKDAIEKIFGVKVKKVNVINVKSKPKRLGIYSGRSRSWKKAIVTLEKGYVIRQLHAAK